MLFIRVSDAVEIKGIENEIIQFSNKKRKGQIVKKFSLDRDENEVKFFQEELTTKMIPAKLLKMMDERPIKILITQAGNILIFQDMDCRAHFLTQDPSSGKIKQVTFDELIPEEDSILCYDEEDNDWYLDDVDQVFMMHNIDDDEVSPLITFLNSNLDIEELDDTEIEKDIMDMELSNYIINSEGGGIIVNGILLT